MTSLELLKWLQESDEHRIQIHTREEGRAVLEWMIKQGIDMNDWANRFLNGDEEMLIKAVRDYPFYCVTATNKATAYAVPGYEYKDFEYLPCLQGLLDLKIDVFFT